MSKFQIILKEDFTIPGPGGLTQSQVDWLLENLFWIGVSDEPGYVRVTFYIPLPEGYEVED
jgi:hypothetical protein